MDNKIKKEIIDAYNSGKGSNKLSNQFKIPKHVILKLLKNEGLIRKRDRCKSLEIVQENDYFVVERICPLCKEKIKTKSKDRNIACRNHFNKINGTGHCKKCSLKLQIGEGNPFYGKKHNKETKNKISNSRKGKATGKNNSMAKKKWRDKSKKNLIKRWQSGELDDKKIFFSERLKQTIREGKIKSVCVSKKEKEILKYIENLGFEVVGSYRIDTKICDIFIPSLNLIIEYNGDYWHCNPKKYKSNYFNHKKNLFAKQIWEYDRNKLEIIRNNGYNLEVIWETDIKNNYKIIKNIIAKYVTKPISTPKRS